MPGRQVILEFTALFALHALVVTSVTIGSARGASQSRVATDAFVTLDRSITEYLSVGRIDSAAARLDRALALAERVYGGDRLELAVYADSLAYRFFEAYAESIGVALFERGVALRESALPPDDLSLAGPLETLATAYYVAGRVADSVTPQERSLGIRIAHLGEDDPAVASSRYELALVYYELARYDGAEEQLRRALAAFRSREPADTMTVAEVERMLGETCRERNRYDEAERRIDGALSLARRALAPGDPDLVTFLNSLAGFYRDQARFDESELLMEEALRIRRDAGLADELAIPTLNLAEIYRFQGRYEDAVPLYREALRLAKTYFPELEVAEFHNQLATVCVETGRLEEARAQYMEALDIVESSEHASPQVVSQCRHDAAVLLALQSRHDEAERLFRRALGTRERVLGPSHPLVGTTLTELARTVAASGRGAAARDRDAEALVLLDRAVAIFRATDAEPEVEAEALFERSELYHRAGRGDEAVSSLAAALDVVEALRPHRGGGRAERIGFFNRYLDYYDRMIEWRVAAGDVGAAMGYAERMRSRVLLDRLAGGGVVPVAGVTGETLADLRKRSVALESRLSECQARTRSLRAKPDLTDDERSDLQRIERDCDELVEDLQRSRERTRRLERVAGDASELAVSSVDMDTAIASIVPGDGVLLLYHIGAEDAYLFVVPPPPVEVELYSLRIDPGGAAALGTGEGALTRGRLTEIIRGHDLSGNETGLGVLRQLKEPFEAAPENVVVSRARRRFHGRLQALFEALIPPSAWRRVRGASEVVVVPDGPLLALPFEALVVEVAEGDGEPVWWLDVGPVLRYAPSITMLSAISQRRRPVATSSGEAVLSVCNPDFNRGGPATSVAGAAAWVSRERFATRGGSLRPLPGTERETGLVVEAFGGEGVAVLCGERATERAVRAGLENKRIVHLATHGLVSLRRNDLLAALALTPEPASSATTRGDGFLQLFEIYDLDLCAELVVLSACESNYGRYVPGEGVMALARGFHSAGASGVVSSLWKVDDAVTADLMGGFFSLVAGALDSAAPADSARAPLDAEPVATVDYARALRDAKLAVRAHSKHSHPFYWAAWVISGTR